VAEGQEANLLHASTNSTSATGIPVTPASRPPRFTLNMFNSGGTVLLVSTPVPGGMVVAP
jgi:hypothetical protein